MLDRLTPYKFEMFDGWPPDGAPGLFFGFDANWNSSILIWRDNDWHGIRWQFDYASPTPQRFWRGADTSGHVLKWARCPLRYSDA